MRSRWADKVGRIGRWCACCALVCLLITVAGCRGSQSALDPAGPQAHRISNLWWLTFWICTVAYVATLAVLLVGIFRSRPKRAEGATDPTAPVADPARGPAGDPPIVRPDPVGERRLTTIVGGAAGLTILILFVLLFADFITGRHVHGFANTPNTVSITLTGHQWWWDVRYEDSTPHNVFTTANEIHIPVGRPVGVLLQSNDVIHSFWVPNLTGKKDLVPGHPNVIYFQADKPGTYYGQCAEYCGYQHANMRLVVIAEPPENFEQWLVAARQPAPEPQTDRQKHGRQVFLSRQCVMCHTIVGTPAGGRVGPDLTHVGSRQTLAAGAIPNRPGHLGGWIIDPQKIKPGAMMPQNLLEGEDLTSLVEYLESLQ